MSNGSKGPSGVNPTNHLNIREPIYADINHNSPKSRMPNGKNPQTESSETIYSEIKNKVGQTQEPLYATVNKNAPKKSSPPTSNSFAPVPPPRSTSLESSPPPRPPKNPLTSQLKDLEQQSISRFDFSNPKGLGCSSHNKGNDSKNSQVSHGYGPNIANGNSRVPKYGNDSGAMTSISLSIITKDHRPKDDKKAHKKFIDKLRLGKKEKSLSISSPSLLETSNPLAGSNALYGHSKFKPFSKEVEKFQKEMGLEPPKSIRHLNLTPPPIPKK